MLQVLAIMIATIKAAIGFYHTNNCVIICKYINLNPISVQLDISLMTNSPIAYGVVYFQVSHRPQFSVVTKESNNQGSR